MAKQEVTSGRTKIIREIGDACQRPGCAGTLDETSSASMVCTGCNFTFAKTFFVPQLEPKEKSGNPPPIPLLPDTIVLAFVKAKHSQELEAALPNPADRKEDGSFPENQSIENREAWMRECRAYLEAVWPEIAEWFGGQGHFGSSGQIISSVQAIQEIAIPSLKYCEENYGHDDQARLNLEAVVKED